MASGNIYNDFFRLTGKNIIPFLTDSVTFLEIEYVDIVKYFEGNIQNITSEPFKIFDDLQKQLKELYVVFESYSNQMIDSRWYELLSQLEEIDNRFATLRNMHKWARSSATNFAFSPNIIVDYTLGNLESLESVAKNVLQEIDSEDSWVDIAALNNLTEEDYSVDTNTKISLRLSNTINLGIKLNSVVDSISGKSVYGKDLDKLIQYDSTTEDFKVLDFDDTMLQTVEILINLKKNNNPDFPTLGLQSQAVVGSNRALMNFPVINRQLAETFASDDTLKGFVVKSMNVDQDNLSVDFEVLTRLNEVQGNRVIL